MKGNNHTQEYFWGIGMGASPPRMYIQIYPYKEWFIVISEVKRYIYIYTYIYMYICTCRAIACASMQMRRGRGRNGVHITDGELSGTSN